MNFWNYKFVLVIRLDEFKQKFHLTIIAQINTIVNCLNLSAPRPFQAMEIAVLSTKKSSRSNAQRVPFFRRPRRTWTRWTGHRDGSKWGLKFGIQMGFCKVQGVFVTDFFWHFWHFVKSKGGNHGGKIVDFCFSNLAIFLRIHLENLRDLDALIIVGNLLRMTSHPPAW